MVTVFFEKLLHMRHFVLFLQLSNYLDPMPSSSSPSTTTRTVSFDARAASLAIPHPESDPLFSAGINKDSQMCVLSAIFLTTNFCLSNFGF